MKRTTKTLLLVLLSSLWICRVSLGADPPNVPKIPRRPADKHVPKLRYDAPIEWIVIKLQEGTHVRLRGRSLTALDRDAREEARLASLGLTAAQVEGDVRSVHALLASNGYAGKLERLYSIAEDVLAKRRSDGESRSGRELADLDLYYRVRVPAGITQAELDPLVDALNALASVEVAYVQPRAEAPADIAPMTPSFEANQGYLDAAPWGIDARYAWTVPGGRGWGAAIVDVEGAWKTTHEDLPGLFHRGGTQYNDAGWRNHGTAVLGVMVAPDNGYGMTGIVNQAWAGYESIGSQSTPNAITNAALYAGVSGTVLIELHAPGPATPNSFCNCSSTQCDFVPMEYFQGEFDAIAAATANGTIVVEAGGNGATNLDDPVYGGRFNRFVRDSGAILVGASESNARTPTCFTNFGSRIDMHGWGWNVATLGYGNLFDGGGDENQFYTGGFNGTSSASPIVTGAATSLIGVSLAYGQGYGYRSPFEIRQILQETGTPQSGSGGNIGPLPNLRWAIPRVLDTRPVAAFTINCTAVTCDANAASSSDDWGIISYAWDWGDGSFSSGVTASHTYTSAGTFTVMLTVTDTVGQKGTSQQVITASLTAPVNALATASGSVVTITWTPSAGATGYDLERKVSSANWVYVKTVAGGATSSTTDTPSAPAGVVLYHVRARAGGSVSAPSNNDVAYVGTFTDDGATGFVYVRAVHITELRRAVNALRDIAALGPQYSPAELDPATLLAHPTDEADFVTLMSNLNTARTANGLPPVSFSNNPTQNQQMKSTQIAELRQGVK
jgi:serine protease